MIILCICGNGGILRLGRSLMWRLTLAIPNHRAEQVRCGPCTWNSWINKWIKRFSDYWIIPKKGSNQSNCPYSFITSQVLKGSTIVMTGQSLHLLRSHPAVADRQIPSIGKVARPISTWSNECTGVLESANKQKNKQADLYTLKNPNEFDTAQMLTEQHCSSTWEMW